MTRSDIVDALAERFVQLPYRDAEFAVRSILDAMNGALVRGNRIEIRGFGSFSVNHRLPRQGRNRAAARVLLFLRGGYCTSSRAKPCVKPLTSKPPAQTAA